jgi:hypothetical protein
VSDDWREQAEQLQQHGLVVETSLSGLKVFIPRTVLILEALTITLFASICAMGLGCVLGSMSMGLKVFFGACALLGFLSGSGILLVGTLHLLVSGSRWLRQRLGAMVQITPRSVRSGDRLIPLEDIDRVEVRKRGFLAHILYVHARDGRTALAHSDDARMLRHLAEIIRDRQRENARQLQGAGHDLAERASPPGALQKLRGEER